MDKLTLRKGDVVARMHDGRAVQNHPVTQRYHCLAYPCPNLTTWFYMPANSHLCEGCMEAEEAGRAALAQQRG